MQVFDYVDVNGGVDGARQGVAVPTIRQTIGERDVRYLRGFPNVMVESDSVTTIPLGMEGSKTKNPLDRFLLEHVLRHYCTSITYSDELPSVFRTNCSNVDSRYGRNARRWEMIGPRFQT